MRTVKRLLIDNARRTLVASAAMLALAPAAPAAAQSPNTATIVVLVSDQQGAAVTDAQVMVTNTQTGAVRQALSGGDGSATVAALPLTGTYTVTVSKQGFGNEERSGITLRSGETATLKVKLLVGGEKAEVTVYGTAEGVRTDPQIGQRLDSERIDETPILGRKVTNLPLLNSAFRQAKGTGDLFVNAIYFVTGAGGRRETTVTLDGANNDEAWGRQTMIATVPIGAIQDMAVALERVLVRVRLDRRARAQHRDQVGHQRRARRGAVHDAAGRMAGRLVLDVGLLRAVGVDLRDAVQPDGHQSRRHPRRAEPGLGLDRRVRSCSDRTFFFGTGDYTRQDRTTALSSALPSFVLPADGSLEYTGKYRQKLLDARVDHKLNAEPDADGAVQLRHLLRHQPAGHGRRHERADGRPDLPPADLDRAVEPHHGAGLEPVQRGALRVSERRPGHELGARRAVHDLHPQRVSAVHHRAVTLGRHVRAPGAALRHAVVVARPALRPLRRQPDAPHVGRHGQRVRFGPARHVHVQQQHDRAVRTADARRRAALRAADQLRHHQLRADAVDDGALRAGQHPRGERSHARPRAALRPADAERRDRRTSRRGSVSAGIPTATPARRSAAATGCTTRRSART